MRTGHLLRAAVVFCVLVCIGASAFAAVEIRYMANPRMTAFGDDVNELLVEIFNELNPDIKVVYEPATAAWQDRATVQMAAGSAPDVIAGFDHWFRAWLDQGQALDLLPYLPSGYLDDFVPSHIRLFHIDGKQYALPLYTGISALYYNQDMFEAIGLTPPDETWDWDDLLDAARKLTRRDETGMVTTYGTDVQVAWDRVILWIWENDGEVIEEGQFVGSHVTFDAPEVVEAIQFLQDLIHSHEVAPSWIQLGMDPWVGFWRGDTVAMWQSGSWDIANTLQQAPFQWNVSVRPRGRNGTAAAVHTSDGIMVYKGTPHPEAAARFVQFLTSRDAQEILMYQANLQPARLSLGIDYATATAPARQGINMGVFVEQTAYARPAPFFTEQTRVSNVMITTFNQVIYQNTMPAQSAMENLTRELNAIMRGEEPEN
mgnify:CR=1 FL=1|jgi:multiple sugar transport system substrate-binding protein